VWPPGPAGTPPQAVLSPAHPQLTGLRRGGTASDRDPHLTNTDLVAGVPARDWPGDGSDVATVYPNSV
jgi:hypothetical protein